MRTLRTFGSPPYGAGSSGAGSDVSVIRISSSRGPSGSTDATQSAGKHINVTYVWERSPGIIPRVIAPGNRQRDAVIGRQRARAQRRTGRVLASLMFGRVDHANDAADHVRIEAQIKNLLDV